MAAANPKPRKTNRIMFAMRGIRAFLISLGLVTLPVSTAKNIAFMVVNTLLTLNHIFLIPIVIFTKAS